MVEFRTVGIVGLGLIGGSLAMAIKEYTNSQVIGYDIDPDTCRRSQLLEAVDRIGTPEEVAACDLVIVGLYPAATMAFMEEYAARFQAGAVVTDICGVKRSICEAVKRLTQQHDFVFVGGHPMAGSEFSGFKYARANLFAGASMLLVPMEGGPIEATSKLKNFYDQLGFVKTLYTTPEEHDHLIAYTSQLAHVVSNGYVKSPSSRRHAGFSAGSFKDLTRVAKLNEVMWTELFMLNRDNLIEEVDGLIGQLTRYRDAMISEDEESLFQLLREGRQIKEGLEQP